MRHRPPRAAGSPPKPPNEQPEMSAGTLQKLVYMANQIAGAFRTQEPEKAAQATYDHLWHYWDPRMRQLICAHHAAGGEGLGPVAARAVELLIHSKASPMPRRARPNSATPAIPI